MALPVVPTVLLILAISFQWAHATKRELDPPAKQLFLDLMDGYKTLIRPFGGPDKKFTVRLGLRLSQVLSVNEKEQILTISVWLRQEWHDNRLTWDPKDHGGVKKMNIPSNVIWIPDLVLYNNADGDFQITLQTKATVYYTGDVVWEPPAIYKSYCPIDVEFFPFDVQECFLKISSWTYHGNEVDLQHVCNGTVLDEDVQEGKEAELIIPRGIDLTDYYYNGEWDVLNVTAMRRVKYYSCCPEPFPDVTFNITLRRRPLFYTINLILPCVSISLLTDLVFYLPCDSGEKITLAISILLALTVFFLLLSDMNPPTSLVIPLIGKYLLFIMLVVTASIILTVYILHINFKSPTTHKMSPWVRRIFAEILPQVLFMERPNNTPPLGSSRESIETDVAKKSTTQSPDPEMEVLIKSENRDSRRSNSNPTSNVHHENTGEQRLEDNNIQGYATEDPFEHLGKSTSSLPLEVLDAINSVTSIANSLRQGDEDTEEERDWKYIATVLDRLFLYVFSSACICGTLSIFLYAPSLYDPREHIVLTDPDSACIY